MASAPYSRSHPPQPAPATYNAHVPPSTTHPGTFAPGTKVQVGQHRVIVEKFLSEGGFAHVYVVRIPKGDKSEVAVLKRVAVPDRESLANMKTEVDTMKRLKGHKYIVTYIDSHASQLKGGGYEVFLLMEYCAGGGLIDFMNTRLQHRLTEPEILHIFSDVSEGVACMHYLKPPLLHRDLKVENVLISTSGSTRMYKLCDFGSAAPPRPAAKTAAEGRLIEDDVQKHTTMQYRSPEMIDVYRKLPINEKSDIWALGVLLYKLCYYTTPFEDQGQMAILNATFKFPNYPVFSTRLKQLISSMLKENPASRPNIYQVLQQACAMRGKELSIKDIYANRTHSETRRNEQLPTPIDSTPIVGLQKVAPTQVQKTVIPDIKPMRRGRPTTGVASVAAEVAASAKGPSQDPFAALDSKNYDVRSAAVDELSTKYPSLDQFSLLHDKGGNFQFSSTSSDAVSSPKPKKELEKRVTEALADAAFAVPTATRTGPVTGHSLSPALDQKRDRSMDPAPRSMPSESAMKSAMMSSGAKTSPLPSPNLRPNLSSRPIWRVPRDRDRDRSPKDLPLRNYENTEPPELELPPRPEPISHRKSLLERARTKSQTALSLPKSSSTRTSLDGQRPLETMEPIHKSKSDSRVRPSSSYMDPNFDLGHDQISARNKDTSFGSLNINNSRKSTPQGESSDDDGPEDPISSNIDFLKSIESNDDPSKRKSRRRSSSNSGKSKLGNIPTISLSGTKNILAGKFGEAFRRFETSGSTSDKSNDDLDQRQNLNAPLSPIVGSEATGTSGRSDDEHETQDLSPEMRRELERRRLSQEEKRVAAAGAEYKRRLEAGDRAGLPTRASSIQHRVKSLLDDTKTSDSNIVRTAEGYGKYTDATKAQTPNIQVISRKPVPSPSKPNFDAKVMGTYSQRPAVLQQPVVNRTGPRPSVAPKPLALRTGATNTPDTGSPIHVSAGAAGASRPEDADEDWEANFTKRYPSLSGIEMVETEIKPGVGRIRDV